MCVLWSVLQRLFRGCKYRDLVALTVATQMRPRFSLLASDLSRQVNTGKLNLPSSAPSDFTMKARAQSLRVTAIAVTAPKTTVTHSITGPLFSDILTVIW